jgi:hypothetical protein
MLASERALIAMFQATAWHQNPKVDRLYAKSL